MGVTFRILPDKGVVYVNYAGLARAEEGARAFAAYMAHPDYRQDQKHFVDLSAVTAIERDYARFMALQAQKADSFVGSPDQTLLVYYAPTRPAHELALLAMRPWESFNHVAARVMEDEAEALAYLGLRETRIADLLATAG